MKLGISLTPSRLRLILFASLGLIALLGAAIFYFSYARLDTAASEAGEMVASAEQSNDTLEQLRNLQNDLEQRQESVDKASQVVADSQNFVYQDLLVNDLTVYAQRAGLAITNISFANQTAATSTPIAPSTSTSVGTPPSAALKTATVDITLSNPVDYESLLTFLSYVEQNLTKLKISKVSLTKSEEVGKVTIDILNLEVHIR